MVESTEPNAVQLKYDSLRRSSIEGLSPAQLQDIGRLEAELQPYLGNSVPLIEATPFASWENMIQFFHGHRLEFTKFDRKSNGASDPEFQEHNYSLFYRNGIIPLAQEIRTKADVMTGEQPIRRLTLGIRTHNAGEIANAVNIYDALESSLLPCFNNYLKLPKNLESELEPEELALEADKKWILDQVTGIFLPEKVFMDALDLTYGPNAFDERRQFLNNFDEEKNARKIYFAVLKTARKLGATDVHIEPVDSERCRIRYRVDGMLKEAEYRVPMSVFNSLINAVKTSAKLRIEEKRLPQDGVITFEHRADDESVIKDDMANEIKKYLKEYSIRVSTIPVLFGEKAVLRMLKLDRDFNLAKLGYPEKVYTQLKRQTELPNGLILVTGPTGSGKTTTLYSALQELNKPDINIGSVEDPIEIPLKGINQTQIRPEIGLTFPEMLRRYLRQDPDVILVGEIRDGETAKIAMEASKTGHLVFSTLHTNDATGTLSRLFEMGVENSDLQNFLRCIVAQRLVRKLCDNCKVPYNGIEDMRELLGVDEEHLGGGIRLYRAKDPTKKCEHCMDMGYRGRKPVTEIWIPGAEEKKLMSTGVRDSRVYLDKAIARGMEPLALAGMEMLLDGTSSIDAVTFEIPFEDFRTHSNMFLDYLVKRKGGKVS